MTPSQSSSKRDLSVIIPASNEEATLDAVLREVEQVHPMEVIVIVNGSRDSTARIAEARHHHVVEFTERLGHDVGRAVGARLASGKALLFVDADMVIPWTEPFVHAIDAGYDVALNDIDAIVRKYPWDPVSVQKVWLNVCLNQQQLQTASLTAVPHALGRDVFQHITPEDLAVPPKAYAKLVVAHARVTRAHSVDVVTNNKIHAWHGWKGGHNLMEELIVGDHLEALAWLRDHQEVVPSSPFVLSTAKEGRAAPPSRSPTAPAPERKAWLEEALHGLWRWIARHNDKP